MRSSGVHLPVLFDEVSFRLGVVEYIFLASVVPDFNMHIVPFAGVCVVMVLCMRNSVTPGPASRGRWGGTSPDRQLAKGLRG